MAVETPSATCSTVDTQQLVVTVDEDGEVPTRAIGAARMGTRIALELLRAPRIPDKLLIVRGRRADRALGTFVQEDEDVVTAHDARTIVLAYDAVTSETYLGWKNPPPEMISGAIAFCAGYEATLYAIEQFDPPEPGLLVAHVEDPIHATASTVACIASEFSMLATDMEGEDPKSFAVGYFLHRLATLSAREGTAAIWRGAIGHAVRAMMREVRFSETPGKVTTFGERLRDAADVLRLVEFAGGRAPWPFAAKPY